MEIVKNLDGEKLSIALIGRLDSVTAPELEAELDLTGITDLKLDMEKLEYISSAGLRVMLGAQKKMNVQGAMVLTNVCETVKEVFDITGFSDILTIE